MTALPHCKAVLSLSFKKIKKIVEKELTSVKVCDKILSVVTAQQNREKTREKKIKKSFKKLLTNGFQYDIIEHVG